MEITLEKIELVKDRTGVSYKEAKAALEAADGSVVDAIINIEESMDYTNSVGGNGSAKENAIIRAIKDTIAKGNMSRIIVRKGDSILLNLPLTVGAVGVVVAPMAIIYGIIAAAGFNCKIEFVNDKGQITDINGKVKKQYRKARAAGQVYYDKGMETVDRFKESEFYGDLKEQGSAMYYDLKDKGQDMFGELVDKGQDMFGDLVDKGQDMFDGIKDKSQDVFDDLKEKTDGIDTDKVKEGLDDLWKKGSDFFHKNEEPEDEDFFESFDLDVDDVEPVVEVDAPAEAPAEADDAPEVATEAPETAPVEAAEDEETAPAEEDSDYAVSEETKEELAKVLEEVAHESGIDNL
jgi:DNA-binding PadR family transcriptional regulator